MADLWSFTGAARHWSATTPGRLRLQSLLVAASTLILLVTGSGSLGAAFVTEIDVHQQTVAAIVGVQRLHAWLAAADRSAANSYLTGGAELTLPQQQYEADVSAASRELEQAGERRIGGGVASQRLQAISQAVSEYTRLVDTAMVQHRLGHPDGMTALRSASDQMHRPGDGILAQVEAVEALYTTVLGRANVTLAIAAGLLAAFVVDAVVLLALLLWTQRFVRRRFRRRHNKRLLAATLATVVVVGGTGIGVAGAYQSILRSQGQYARLLNLWHARSLAYDANGATSRFLIEGGSPAVAADAAEVGGADQLVDRPLTDELLQEAARGRVLFDGLLADELRAAASGAERDAAMRVVVAYRQFADIDASVHAQAAAGHQAAAVTLTLGTYGAPLGLAFKSLDWGPRLGAVRDWSEGELGYAFGEFDWDLARLTALVQREFDSTMTGVVTMLAQAIGLQAVSVAIAVLTFAGLRPRIAEYRV